MRPLVIQEMLYGGNRVRYVKKHILLGEGEMIMGHPIKLSDGTDAVYNRPEGRLHRVAIVMHQKWVYDMLVPRRRISETLPISQVAVDRYQFIFKRSRIEEL